jgi:Fe2+ or Zn2+ uptake regulation protein
VIEDIMRARGVMMTDARRLVLQCFEAADAAMDIEQALGLINADGRRISRSGVGRAIRTFQDLGVIELSAMRASKRFYRLRSTRRRLHLIVDGAGRVIEVDAEDLVDQLEVFLAHKGYRLAGGVDLRVVPLKEGHPTA